MTPRDTPQPLPAHWPVLGVCGFQDSGKTTLLEAAIPQLVSRGLRVAVVKADAHGIDVDQPGKDSDRLFRAGATVALCGPDEAMLRAHTPGGKAPLTPVVAQLLRQHDLVLVEGHKFAPLAKLWLHGKTPQAAPAQATGIVAELAWEPVPRRVERLLAEVAEQLERAFAAQPCHVGLLIGGASKRMGEAKHRLAMPDGRELLEHLVERFKALGHPIVLLGNETVAPSLSDLPCLPDVFDEAQPSQRRGPLAGMLAALRFAPEARWLFAACDQPALEADGLAWLAAQLAPGTWGAMALHESKVQALPFVCDDRLRDEVERLLQQGSGPRRLAAHPAVRTVELPPSLQRQWQDVDTPEQWQAFRG